MLDIVVRDFVPQESECCAFLVSNLSACFARFQVRSITYVATWRGIEDVEIATLEWDWWFNHQRLLEPIGCILSVGSERNVHTRQEESQSQAVLT